MPIFVIIIGKLFFNLQLSSRKVIGVSIAFLGLSFLLLSKGINEELHFFYIMLAVIAAMSYGLNSNLIANKLKNITSLKIISISMSVLAIPSLLTLLSTGFFSRISTQPSFMISTFSSAILGIFGTATASGLFYVLIKRAGSVFASLVTNSMPIVAVFWGFLSGESITMSQIFCLFIILGGIYYANKS